jgi:hypothetical protein
MRSARLARRAITRLQHAMLSAREVVRRAVALGPYASAHERHVATPCGQADVLAERSRAIPIPIFTLVCGMPRSLCTPKPARAECRPALSATKAVLNLRLSSTMDAGRGGSSAMPTEEVALLCGCRFRERRCAWRNVGGGGAFSRQMPRSKRTTLLTWAHQYRVMADRLAFHVRSNKLDGTAVAVVREAEQALRDAAIAVERTKDELTAA